LNWYPSLDAVVPRTNAVPDKFTLSQNYPNPFNPSTVIKVGLKQSGNVSLKIYNVLGEVVDIIHNGYINAGSYSYTVNMDRFASGVYFYSLREGANVLTRKMMLLSNDTFIPEWPRLNKEPLRYVILRHRSRRWNNKRRNSIETAQCGR